MIRQTVVPVLLAGLIVLAGCASFAGPGLDSANAPDSGSNDVQTGTVNFYISDERNAIGDFEHLNVTITKVGFQKAGDEEDDEADENESESQEDANETETDANETTANTTEASAQVNGTETATNASDSDGNESETTEAAEAEEQEDESDEENESREGWVERDVDNVTVDLTEYQGANATLLSQFDLPNGTYNKVFIYISEINATLSNGEQVNVKLPSDRLHLNEQFTVGNGESIDFVFDLTVFKAGNSGKYILKPVASESGTDVPIEAERPEQAGNASEGEGGPPDDVGNEADENDSEGPGGPPDADSLDIAVDGPVRAGEDVTLTVTEDGDPVQNAQVFVDGERVGQTAADGTLTVSVPEDADALNVTIEYRGTEVETTVMVESASGEETTTASA